MNDQSLKLRKLRRPAKTIRGEVVGWVILPNSTRSTMAEIIRLRDEEFARTGIEWEVCDA